MKVIKAGPPLPPLLYTGKHCHVTIPVYAIPRNLEFRVVSMNLIIIIIIKCYPPPLTRHYRNLFSLC
jgi:hypothetical protein